MNFSFRSKLGFSVAILTVILTGGSLLYLYWNIYTLIWTETQDKLKSIGKVGAFIFNEQKRKDLEKLIENIRSKQDSYTI
jgi:hypothetical protein